MLPVAERRCRLSDAVRDGGHADGHAAFFPLRLRRVLGALPPQSFPPSSPPRRTTLAIDYRTYDDGMPRDEYLEWTGVWIEAAARVLAPDGSLFLNVGAKPTDPWTAMDVAQAARRHLQLQNTIHWIKSIAIDKDAAGAGAGLTRPRGRPLQANQQPALPERLPRVHLPLHAAAGDARWIGGRSACPIRTPVEHRAMAAAGGSNLRCRGNTWFIPYDTIKSRDKDRPHPATFPPRVPEYCLRLHGLDRAATGRGSVPRAGQHGGRVRQARGSTSPGSRSTSTTSTKPSPARASSSPTRR